MNLFETVKAAVTPRMAAERYGLRGKRRCDRPCGKALQPERL